MNTRKIALLGSISALALVTACSSGPRRAESPGYGYNSGSSTEAVQFGNVSSIDVVASGSRSSGGGAVLGAVLGAVVGNQIGSGSGRAAATGLGAVGGAVIGNSVEMRNKGDSEVYRVRVRLDNGRTVQFDYQRIDDLRVGDRVKLEGGQLYRV